MDNNVPSLNENPEYKLASIFKAHDNDVKQVISTPGNNLITCSRDDTIKVWGSK